MTATRQDLRDLRPEPEAAKRRYLEQSGSLIVNNHVLRIALLASLFSNLALGVALYRLVSGAELAERFVVQIDEFGRTAALKFSDVEYRPRADEVRYFLANFARKHFARQRSSIAVDYPQSLHFLEEKLARAAMDEFRDQRTLENVVAGASQEIRIIVDNVIVQGLDAEPHEAFIDFQKVYLSSYGAADRREKYVAEVSFFFRKRVPNEMVPLNPLGLTIQSLSLHQAFAGESAR